MSNCCLKWHISQSGLSENRAPPCYSLIASPSRSSSSVNAPQCWLSFTERAALRSWTCLSNPSCLPPPQGAVKGGASEDLARGEHHWQTPVVKAELFEKGGLGNLLWRTKQLICHAWWNVWEIQVIYFTSQKDRKHLERFLTGKRPVLIKLPSLQHPHCCRYELWL